MEIIQQFQSPAVWAAALLGLILQYLLKHGSGGLKAYLKGSNLKELRRIKSLRHCPDHVTFETMKANSYYLVFMGVCALYFLLFTIGPLNQLKSFPLWVSIIVMSPIFVMEILWLNQSSFAKRLIKYRARLRVTNRSSRPPSASA